MSAASVDARPDAPLAGVVRDHDEGLTVLRLDRSEVLNAFDGEVLASLREALLDAQHDEACRALLLTGSGRAFCAGADVRAFAAALGSSADPHLAYRTPTLLHEVIGLMVRLGKPIVAAVNGPAVGAGFPLAAAADVLVAAESAYFALGYFRIGLAPDGSSTFRLPRSIGVHKTFELLALGSRLSAEEARALGFVARVYPDADFDAEARSFGKGLAALPTRAVAEAKALLLRSFETGLETQLEHETEGLVRTSRSEDFRRGVAGFVEKRPPAFVGR